MARELALRAVSRAGQGIGMARGAVHTVEDVAHGAKFVARLTNPLDKFISLPGESAAEQVVDGAVALGGWAKKAYDRPQMVVEQAKRGLDDWNVSHNPYATPEAPTFNGEARRQFDLSMNQGEFAFDVGSLALGGAAPKALRGLRVFTPVRATTVEQYMARGMPKLRAEHFAEPYPRKLMGSHFWPRNKELPAVLGGGKLPKVISDSPLNVVKPKNYTRAQLYEHHVGVDLNYNGGKIRREGGGGTWNAEGMGWPKYGRLGRIWHGAPTPLKLTIGAGGILGIGAAESVKNRIEP